MSARVVSLLLGVGLVFSLLALIPRLGSFHLPGNQQGYEPAQPVAFSHRLHAGDLQISCIYCHSGAETSRHAGIPPAGLCMNCHKTVTASLATLDAEDAEALKEKRKPTLKVSPELRKLYDAVGLDDKLQAGRKPHPLAWIKVHNLPDFACFDHRPHVHVGLACQKCHGPVETMERVRQVEDLSMGWCVNCHREMNRTGVHGKKVSASTDCAACHY